MNPAEFVNIARSEEKMWWYRGMRHILAAWIARWPRPISGSVLEAGCGTGFMSRWLAGRYGWQMTPLDLDFAGLRYARSVGMDRLTQADICRLPYATGSFDAVVSLDVVVHLPRGREGEAFSEFHRVLRPGSPLILRVSALDALRSRHSVFAHERQRFTRRRLVEELTRAGFAVRHVSYANSLLTPVAWFKFRVWEELTNQPPASGVEIPFPALNWLLEVPLRIEAVLPGAGLALPLGQSLVVLAEKT